jgi:hypothetical protein
MVTDPGKFDATTARLALSEEAKSGHGSSSRLSVLNAVARFL